jgi:deoxycytidylate deaminase
MEIADTTHKRFFGEAEVSASLSACKKARCGAVIVRDGKVIGRGFNSPAGGEPHRCLDSYSVPENNRHDITCCVHAEIRAMHDAMANSPMLIGGSTLYFSRIDESGDTVFSGMPYCTLCSREALDGGIGFFALWHESGIKVYNTQEYNSLTYRHFKEKPYGN